uniref:Protein krueppel n=1 Tax=Anopheles funestus TaxID=62324 RepID=A0A1I8JUM8_ANOFN
MDSVPRDLINICRFCLCQDESKLRSIEEILPLSIKDVERFTGIKINMDANLTYAICFNCTQKLRISANFRQFCLRNNAHFQELLGVLLASMKSVPTDSVKPKMHEERDPLDLHFDVEDNDEEVEKDVVEIYDDDDDDEADVNDTNSPYQKAWKNQEENYSANYIDLGENSESDDYDHGYEYSSFSINKHSENLAQPTTTNIPDEESQERVIITQRTRKSYLPQLLCNLCGKLVTNIGAHLESHANHRKHACPHCPVRMTDKGNLDRHIKAVHLKLITKTCPVCGKGFTNNNSYLSHMIAHHGIGDRYTCKLCSRIFNQKSSLSDHMRRTHSNVRNVVCNICGKAFKVSRALREHMKVHSTDQPYPCGQCPKRFKSSYALKTHEITHSGIVFECALCGKTYRYKSLLNMHIRKTHPEQVELPEEQASA